MGTCSRNTVEENQREIWERVNAIVMAWVMNSATKDLLSGVVYLTEASQVWKDLQECFDKPNGTQIFLLLKQINTLSQGSMNISTYFTKLKYLWDELASIVEIPFALVSCDKTRRYLCRIKD